MAEESYCCHITFIYPRILRVANAANITEHLPTQP